MTISLAYLHLHPPFHWPLTMFLIAALSVPNAAGAELSALEAKGKQLYFHGTLLIGSEPKALIGEESTSVPASIVPCAGCHGEDGAGRPEGAVVPPDVTWRFLTKPYGHKHPNARMHPAFTEKSLGAAIQQGIDPAGNKLDSVMPRYAFSVYQLAAIIAYLKRIETDQAPGVSEDSIRVGTILPLKGAMADIGEGMRSVLVAYFNEVNRQGGIYSRKLKLQVVEAGETPDLTLAKANRMIEGQQIFALVGAVVSGVDKEMAALVEQGMVPLVGPMTLFPQDGPMPNRYSFYLFSGIKVQMRTLVDYVALNLGLDHPQAAVVYPENGLLPETLAALEQQGKMYQWASPTRVGYSPGRFEASATIGSLKERGVSLVFFLGGDLEFKDFLVAAETAAWHPYVLLPGSAVQNDILLASADLASKVFLAFPTLPADLSREGIAAFNALREKYEFPRHHFATQVTAYCSAQLLVQGLKLAGRQLSRRKLISALESLYDFETGLTPRLSFGPNRHIGAPGAYVVNIDSTSRRFKAASNWIIPREFRSTSD